MTVLTQGMMRPSSDIATEQRVPLASRPFGLDALTNTSPADDPYGHSFVVDPASQLSLVDGKVYLDGPVVMEDTACHTGTDRTHFMDLDYDANDD